MANRFNIDSGPGGLRSGYDRSVSPEDYSIPSCGIEDVDVALFNTFEKELRFEVSQQNAEAKAVPVVFAAGEKWAMLKRGKPLRDKNNTLILPLITITRTSVAQDSSTDINGRGINQQTGELVIKRRLDPTDREYQAVVNRLRITNQDSAALGPDQVNEGQIGTLRDIGDIAGSPDIIAGGNLGQNLKNNVFQILTIPAPQFFTAKYEVTFWTQYTTHMNQMLEKLISSYLPQGNALKLVTPKGYWFIATVEGNNFTPETNFDDMTNEERMIRCKFNMSVPAYLVASSAPGVPVPVRQYVSAPTINFDVQTDTAQGVPFSGETITEPYLGSDDPTLPLANSPRRPDGRLTDLNGQRLALPDAVSPTDPALDKLQRGASLPQYRKVEYVDPISGKKMIRNIRIRTINKYSGETTISSISSLDELTTITKNNK